MPKIRSQSDYDFHRSPVPEAASPRPARRASMRWSSSSLTSSIKAALASCLQATGSTLVLHNLPAGDWAAGERRGAGSPSRPDRGISRGRRTGDRLRLGAPLSAG